MSKSNAQVKIPVMLVSPNKEIGRIQFPCFAQTKMDGMRGVIVKRDGRVVVFSRNGNTMTKLDKHFEAALSSIDNVVLDGELTVVDSDGKLLDRKTGNGILNKTVVETVSDEEVSRVVFTAWDLIDVCDFDKGIDRRTGVERLARLRAIPKLFDVESGTQLFRIVETFEVANLEEAQQLFKEQLAKGEEGIILKNNDHVWENKRSKQCVKMKEVIEMDLKITGFAEGTGKASGMTGAIQVENKDGSIKTSVGTGLDDATRKDIWARQEELIGTIVTVKCNGVISRKGADSKSLFLPVFVELRLDKTESD